MSNEDSLPLGHRNIVCRYWQAYGGWRAMLKSPYLYTAIVLTCVLENSWLTPPPSESASTQWWDTAIAVLPNLLGFSLGGFLMWIGIGDPSFKAWMHSRSDHSEPSVFLEVSATFVHFVVIQIMALVFAVVAKHSQFLLETDSFVASAIGVFGLSRSDILGWLAPTGYACGFFLFVYALLTALEAALGVFRVSSWQDFHAQNGAAGSAGGVTKTTGRRARRRK